MVILSVFPEMIHSRLINITVKEYLGNLRLSCGDTVLL